MLSFFSNNYNNELSIFKEEAYLPDKNKDSIDAI